MTISIRRTAMTVGLLLLVGLLAVGLVQAASSSGGALPAPAAGANASTAAAAGANAQTADDASIANELDAILAADQASPAPQAARIRLAAGPLRRLAAARRLVHATVVLDLPKAGLTTIQIDHGTIASVGTTSLTIAEAGGGSPTVTLRTETRVRRNGAKAAIGDLKTGDEVFVMSKVGSGGTVAYLVVVPKS